MGKNSNISWCDHTHNFWYGCTKVSAGCKFCYAERDMKRFGKDFNTLTRSKSFDAPFRWHEPAKVFVCSWSDFFHPDIPLEWIGDAWEIIKATPWLTYQILTKRPELIASRLPDDWGKGYPNVWLGVTVESQEYTTRMDILERIPAVLRFVSYEPAIGHLDINAYLIRGWHKSFPLWRWVIAGGESGPGSRMFMLDWAHSIQYQCSQMDTAFFFKQWGGTTKVDGAWGGDKLGGLQYHEFPG